MDIAGELAKMSKGQANKNKKHRVFDWASAARRIKGANPDVAMAGLGGDWDFTCGTIYEDGEPVLDGGAYLSSNWAHPELNMDGAIADCWIWADETEWDEATCWPQEALDILKGETQ
jgi:hypothetical protein